MKKTLLFVAISMLIGMDAYAQLKVAPKLSLDHSGLTISDSSVSGKFSLNPEVLLEYRLSDRWAAGIGTGYRRAKTKAFGTMSAVPIFANVSYGNEFGIDFNIGYMIPVNSTYTPVLSGPFARVGAFIRAAVDDDDFLIGAYFDVFNITSTTKIPAYIPDGYGPIVSGVSFGLYIKYAFSIKH